MTWLLDGGVALGLVVLLRPAVRALRRERQLARDCRTLAARTEAIRALRRMGR